MLYDPTATPHGAVIETTLADLSQTDYDEDGRRALDLCVRHGNAPVIDKTFEAGSIINWYDDRAEASLTYRIQRTPYDKAPNKHVFARVRFDGVEMERELIAGIVVGLLMEAKHTLEDTKNG